MKITEPYSPTARARASAKPVRMAGVSRGSWSVFDAPEAKAEVYGVFDARDTGTAVGDTG